MAGLGLVLAALVAAPPALAQSLLPEMQTQPLPTSAGDPEIDGDELRFSNAWSNHGKGPWETAPVGPASADDCDGDGSATNDVIVVQRIYQDANGNGVFNRGTDTEVVNHPGGCMVFHPGHNHFHVEDAGLYALLAEPTGAPAGASSKVSFCLLDISPFDLDLPGAPQSDFYDSCSASVQGISVGWFDEYSLFLDGQSIDISGISAGTYCLRSHFDPESRFPEIDETNNLGEQRYTLDPNAETVTPVAGPCNVPPAPDTTLTAGPANGSVITDTTPSFTFESTESASTFDCRVDFGEFTSCASPHTTASLVGGQHTFAVRAVGPVSFDDTPAARTFTVDDGSGQGGDTTPPNTKIIRGPQGKTEDRTPKFRFRADEPATFECKLDRRRWRPCDSPRTYRRRALGRHKFKVRATDLAGNVERKPAKKRFKIVRR